MSYSKRMGKTERKRGINRMYIVYAVHTKPVRVRMPEHIHVVYELPFSKTKAKNEPINKLKQLNKNILCIFMYNNVWHGLDHTIPYHTDIRR